jgi:uncharacterized coiled-coil DUF342 family protein
MNDIIEIKESFHKYKMRTDKIMTKIEKSEETMEKIRRELDETNKWSGEAHDQCAHAIEPIKEYTVTIKDLIMQLDTCLHNLEISVSDFESKSRNVQNWKAW